MVKTDFGYPEKLLMRVSYHPVVAKKMLRDLKRFKKKVFNVPDIVNTKEVGIWLTNDGDWSEWELIEESLILLEEYLTGVVNLKPEKTKRRR